MTQAVLLNLTDEALRYADVRDDDTPTLFLPHTVVDDLRQAELNLMLGYTVPVASAMRDALDATVLRVLLSHEREKALPYFESVESKAPDVRKELERLKFDTGLLASLWFFYAFLSQYAHPNIERLAHVMDERVDDDGNVTRTYNAGATNNEGKLRYMGVLDVSCVSLIILVLGEALKRFLGATEYRAYRAASRDIVARIRPLVTDVPARGEPPDDDSAYAKKLRARFAKQRALLIEALGKLPER